MSCVLSLIWRIVQGDHINVDSYLERNVNESKKENDLKCMETAEYLSKLGITELSHDLLRKLMGRRSKK